jgi:hypothetical protein
MSLDLFTAEFSTLSNDQRYSAITSLAQAQPTESNRHDFKSVWTNDAIKDVAAFANTFGGILVIGVEKNQNDHTARVVGVPSSSELTTGIASAIATNISPTPSYDIMECYQPSDSNKRFCVVRVRSDARLCLVTKKDISSPVWVRNADQTIRADASQLRGMIEREKQSLDRSNLSLPFRRSKLLFDDIPIGVQHIGWPAGAWQRSETFLKLSLVPTEMKVVSLDGLEEQRFRTLVRQYNRRVRHLGPDSSAASDADNRSADFYEYRWYHKNLDYESRWRITSNFDVAHATQIAQEGQWSIMDVVSYVALLLTIGGRWWKSLGYYGEGILFAELSVGGLQLRQGRQGEFQGLFSPWKGDYAIGGDAVLVSANPKDQATSIVKINFASMCENFTSVVTALMNGLLRSLGHAVIVAEFEKSLQIIFKPTDGFLIA